MVICDRCGFEGDVELYRHIGNVMCCGPLVFKECPRCGENVICDRQEMRREIEEAAREVSRLLEEAIGRGDGEAAGELLDRLHCFNRTLNLEPLGDYIRASGRRINRIRAAPGSGATPP